MKKNIFYAIIFGMTLTFGSCTDYLEKDEQATLDPAISFKNFNNFQGFIEEIYNTIPDKEKHNYCVSFNWGDDEIMNAGLGDGLVTRYFDNGDYRNWYSNNQSFLWDGDRFDPTLTGDKDHRGRHPLWQGAWYCIRKANLGLENLDKLVGSQEEKDIIAGQLYFFRAWWYEELMQFFGGLPYIEKALDPLEEMRYPRLSFQECADKCAADFRKAADLLPNDWDKTLVGQKTLGKNGLRLTKATALGYLGKVLLWASSPLMENGASTDGAHTYDYNKEYAQRAADALGEVLTLIEGGQTPYALAKFDYTNVYNHERSSGAPSCYSDIFYTVNQNWQIPGSTEAMFRNPSMSPNASNWNFSKTWGTKINNVVVHDKVIHLPTANYINYAYGMANGLPLDDPDSGFDETQPFKDRDPRFYHDIIFDGFKYISSSVPASDVRKEEEYCNLYTGGSTRDISLGSRTGYYCQKLVPHQCNEFDDYYGWGHSLHCNLPYMRVADLYLMYAEACAAIGGAKTKSATFSKTAEEAINVLRDRVGVKPVNEKYTADPRLFMDEVRRERACELAFEGFRWNDLQRWLLLTVAPYNTKTSQEFYRNGTDRAWFEENDPRDATVTGWKEETILTRRYSIKHYWLPLPESVVNIYEGFGQNEGW